MGWVRSSAFFLGVCLFLAGAATAIGGNGVGVAAMVLSVLLLIPAFANAGSSGPTTRADSLTPGTSKFTILYTAANKKGTLEIKRAWFDQADTRTLDGEEFEWWVAEALRRQGWLVEITASSGDYGADLVAMKNGQRTAVQVKRYEKQVGVAAVQQVMGGAAHWGCTGKMVVTTAKDFTPAAKKLAATTGTRLVAWHEVERWRFLSHATPKQSSTAIQAPRRPTVAPRRSRRIKDAESLDPYVPNEEGFFRGFWVGLTGGRFH